MNYRFVMLLEETDEFFYTIYIRKITPVKLLMRAVSLLSKEQIKLLLRGAAASALGNLISSHRHKREIFFKYFRQVASARCFRMPCREAPQTCLAVTHRGTSKDSHDPQSASVLHR